MSLTDILDSNKEIILNTATIPAFYIFFKKSTDKIRNTLLNNIKQECTNSILEEMGFPKKRNYSNHIISSISKNSTVQTHLQNLINDNKVQDYFNINNTGDSNYKLSQMEYASLGLVSLGIVSEMYLFAGGVLGTSLALTSSLKSNKDDYIKSDSQKIITSKIQEFAPKQYAISLRCNNYPLSILVQNHDNKSDIFLYSTNKEEKLSDDEKEFITPFIEDHINVFLSEVQNGFNRRGQINMTTSYSIINPENFTMEYELKNTHSSYKPESAIIANKVFEIIKKSYNNKNINLPDIRDFNK